MMKHIWNSAAAAETEWKANIAPCGILTFTGTYSSPCSVIMGSTLNPDSVDMPSNSAIGVRTLTSSEAPESSAPHPWACAGGLYSCLLQQHHLLGDGLRAETQAVEVHTTSHALPVLVGAVPDD